MYCKEKRGTQQREVWAAIENAWIFGHFYWKPVPLI